ncbi:oligosaccharide flippase family protein [Nocardioides sp. LML1-1-1.1]
MDKGVSSAGRRLRVITVDQAVSGASNVLILVLAAQVLGVEAFGLYGIVFTAFVTVQGCLRALLCEPLLVHPEEAEERPGDAIGTTTLLGLGAGVLLVLAGLVTHLWHGELANSFIVLGVCMPLIALQDLGRYLGFTTHRPSFSLMIDTVWLVLMIAAIVLLAMLDHSSLVTFVAAWAGSGALAGMLVFTRFGLRHLHVSLNWLRETWSFSWRYLIGFASTQMASLSSSVVVGVAAGADALGAVRGTVLITRPVGLVHLASVAAGTAEISRLEPGSAQVRRHVRRTTLLTVVASVVNMAVLLLLPDSVGRLVLKDVWEPTQALLLPATVQMVLYGAICGTRAGLLGMRAVHKTVRIDIATTVILTAAICVGVVVGGVTGAYWALVAGQAVCNVIWWTTYLRHRPEDQVGGRAAEDSESQSGDSGSQPASAQ